MQMGLNCIFGLTQTDRIVYPLIILQEPTVCIRKLTGEVYITKRLLVLQQIL